MSLDPSHSYYTSCMIYTSDIARGVIKVPIKQFTRDEVEPEYSVLSLGLQPTQVSIKIFKNYLLIHRGKYNISRGIYYYIIELFKQSKHRDDIFKLIQLPARPYSPFNRGDVTSREEVTSRGEYPNIHKDVCISLISPKVPVHLPINSAPSCRGTTLNGDRYSSAHMLINNREVDSPWASDSGSKTPGTPFDFLG